MPAERSDYVTLARILRPRGNRGEVAAEILTDFPERLTELREVFLWDGTSAPRPARVVRAWLSQSHGGQAIFHFDGCDSIAAAEKLRGLEVQIPLGERVALPAGRYYVTDLIGCEVREAGTSVALGHVGDVQFAGAAVSGTPLLVVETSPGSLQSGRGELLIPLAEDICRRIDVAARLIEVTLPEGLRELNQD